MPSAVRRVGGVGEIFGEELSESFLVKWRHQPLAPSRVVEKWRTKRGKHWTPVYIGAIPKKRTMTMTPNSTTTQSSWPAGDRRQDKKLLNAQRESPPQPYLVLVLIAI
jgi:hypothetical protein